VKVSLRSPTRLCSPASITSHLLSQPPRKHTPTSTFSCPQLASPLHLTGDDGHLHHCCFQGRDCPGFLPLLRAGESGKAVPLHGCTCPQAFQHSAAPTPVSCHPQPTSLCKVVSQSESTAPERKTPGIPVYCSQEALVGDWEALYTNLAQTISFSSSVKRSQTAWYLSQDNQPI